MRLLFAHDHRFFRGAGGELYTPGSFPAAAWDRYLEHFDELSVMARDGGELPEGARLARADRKGVRFEFFPSLSSFRQFVLRSPRIEKRMSKAVKSADAVVARLPSEIGLLAIRHAQRLGKPYAVEVVGCAWDGYLNNGALSARAYAPFAFMRTRRAVAAAPLALYVTASWLQKRYPTGGEHESASNVALARVSAEERKRRKARLAALKRGERPILGTVASLYVRSKGIQTALSALSQLRRSGLDFDYRVLGPGPVEPWRKLACKLGVSDLVHFDGTRSAGKDVLEWLAGIDIHLQPSFQEGLPRATIEAMSRGVACIGSTTGGIPELLPPQRLHKPGDARALARHIRELASDPDEIAKASAADEKTAERYLPEALGERRSAFFGRLRELAENAREKR